jgi:hypothetical protein
VTLKLPYRLAAAAGLWLTSLGTAAEPPLADPPAHSAAAADQSLAEAVARAIAGSRHGGLKIDVVCEGGVVELQGDVADRAQRDDLLRLARGVRSVVMVRDGLTIGAAVQPVNGVSPLSHPGAGVGAPGLMPGGPGAVVGGVGGIDPMPINGGPGGGHALAPPSLPPYAWPTYAPYNNYSRVAYPEEYPHAAFPFIGPFYPFPKVPLGFRSIKLEWEDGHWWYGRKATYRDWWQVRYW